MNTTTQHILRNAFGFDPEESLHHFLVEIPDNTTGEVLISEHYNWDAEKGSSKVTYGTRPDGQIRVVLARPKWTAIADEVRAQFNRRLRRDGRKPGVWQGGVNAVRRDLGKELVLLAWAIEDADPGLIPNAIANWNGLEPEERWWLYTQTAAATGHGINHKGTGWRKAVRYALTENPVLGDVATETRMADYMARAMDVPLFKAVGIVKERESE
jgi:hypothetical protein